MSKEQIEKMVKYLNNTINVERNSYFGKGCITMPLIEADKILDILKGYCKQSGNTVELPCKVGETIYLPWEFDGIKSIAYLTVTHIIFDREHNYVKTDFRTDDEAYYDKYKCGSYEFEDFGQAMIEGIIALILLFVGIVACIIWSANTAIKWQRIFTEIFACLGVLALCILIGCGAMMPERDTADAAKIETSEIEQEQKIEIAPVDTTASITITTESLTNEQLIKRFLDKWDGVLPDTIIITIGGNEG